MFDYMEKLSFFHQNGYVIFESALELSLIDTFWGDVEDNLVNNPNLTMSKYGQILKNSDIPKNFDDSIVPRIIDMEKHSKITPSMMLHEVVQTFLFHYYNSFPTAIQTLTYKYSSQQGEHSDLNLVYPISVGSTYEKEHLTAAWFACEDSNEDNGALIIYPGSHLLEKKTIADFDNNYGNYVNYLKKLCADAGIVPKPFIANKGDLLFWHGDFIHAGGSIKVQGKTRKSLVVHYSKLDENNIPRDKNLTRHTHGRSWYYK